MITNVGKILWYRSTKQERRSTMGEMRKLGALLHTCRQKQPECCGHDMLRPEHFRLVLDSINKMVDRTGKDVKGSLKLSLGYLIKKAARFTKSEFIIDGNAAEVKARDEFLTLLDCSWGYVFHDAIVQIENNRETCLRRPSELPLEEDVKILKEYVVKKIEKMTSEEYLYWTSQEFIELRNLLVCRLTLFNGRRGGEPARLLLKEWLDAEQNVWISPQMIDQVTDPLEQHLFGKFKLAYQRGKGARKMVPILIPTDCIRALKILVEKRESCGILKENPYLFGSIRSRDGHALGWQCVNSACINANVQNPNLLTSTKMRHRASTYFALLDLPESARKAFYSHMGHSQKTNEMIYQCPPSVMEIAKVGRYLHDLDSGNCTATVSGIYF
jgi:hypothetical protein